MTVDDDDQQFMLAAMALTGLPVQYIDKGIEMKTVFSWISILIVVTLALGGCSPSKTDVTHSPQLSGFLSIAKVVWITRVKMPLAEIKEYTGVWHLYILAPYNMEYAAGKIPHLRLARVTAEEQLKGSPGVHFVGFVPAGTRLRFKKLWLDNGEGSLLWIRAKSYIANHI